MAVLEEKKGFFGKLSERIGNVLGGYTEIDESLYDELEEVLITSDIGMDTTMRIMQDLRDHIKFNNIKNPERVKDSLVSVITWSIDKGDRNKLCNKYPLIILMIGINGGGKTTTIAKLGYRLKNQGRTVMLAAADTFRAAAGEQLEIWGDRIGVNTVRHQEGADPSSVIYDAIQSAKAKNIDVLICDTAGRLQTKRNLMQELEKMNKVISKEYPEAERETLLVLDATTGKNAISQAKEFNEVADVTGIVLTKLDGTAKGGIAITVTDEFNIPIKFIGVGEKLEDLQEFHPRSFAGGVISE
ncbi:MAG: signal recognition particle-docking protein FtsY [Firmicutes bacterium]|nr:signal recognition particle-docking protein FtsY [Bacillota bacterium]